MTPRRLHVRDAGYETNDRQVYVGRRLGSPLGNRHFVGHEGVRSRKEAVARFRTDAETDPVLIATIRECRGRDIVCHCGPRQSCHGDVILELANQEKQHVDSETRRD
jgi:hypothetical protein